MFSVFKRKYKEWFNTFDVGDIIKANKPDHLEDWEHYDAEIWEVFKVGNSSYLVRCAITEPFYIKKYKNRNWIPSLHNGQSNGGPYGELNDGFYYTRLERVEAATEYEKIGESKLKITHNFKQDIKSLIE